jgi:hypothetical protein
MPHVPSMSSDPADLSSEDRARTVAAILAAGLVRLRKPVVLLTSPPPLGPENLSESLANRLAVSGDKSVTVTAG